MAETKTQSKKAKAKGRTSTKPRKAAKPRKRSTSKPAASKAKAPSKPQAVLNTVEETAKDAGGAVGNAAGKVGHAAGKAKVPLMAGGAALAGMAGGIAFGNRQAHRHNGIAGVSSKELAKAAKKAGGAGLRVGELALEGRRAREARNGNGKVHRSPIEVVLQGLTSRS
jgi:hypothetical protein